MGMTLGVGALAQPDSQLMISMSALLDMVPSEFALPVELGCGLSSLCAAASRAWLVMTGDTQHSTGLLTQQPELLLMKEAMATDPDAAYAYFRIHYDAMGWCVQRPC